MFLDPLTLLALVAEYTAADGATLSSPSPSFPFWLDYSNLRVNYIQVQADPYQEGVVGAA